MVGAAQYQDKEIDWVLSAVVGKKKQSYIQTHFKEKFGRPLNHNQIRYIKNKYGKDPRFNSPLVNIRAPMRVTTPEPDGLSDHGDEDEQSNEPASENQNEAGPSTHVAETQDGPEDESTTPTRSKRKRGIHDSGDVLEKLIKQTTESQRLDLRPQQTTTLEPILRDNLCEVFSPQWNIGHIHLPVSRTHTHPLPTFPTSITSLEDNCHDPLYAGVYDGTQQPQTLQFYSTSTGIGWTPSVSLSSHSWGVRNSPVFTSTSGDVDLSTMIQASLVTEPYHTDEQAHALFQSPTTSQYQPRLSASHLVASPVSQFSPSMPNLALSPYTFHQEQQHCRQLQQEQQSHSHIGTSSAPVLPSSDISHLERQPYLYHVSGAASYQVPSLQEVTIEPACSHHATEHSDLAETGSCTNWAHATASSPHEIPLFDFIPSPMGFPFQNVKYTGLTAASSRAIRQSLLNHPNVHDSSLFIQQQHHLAPQFNQHHLSFDANTFQLPNMVQNPTLNNTTMPHTQPSYSGYNSTMAFSPATTQAGYQPQLHPNWATPVSQAHEIHGAVNEFSGTIDPRLLVSSSISPHPRPSMSPLIAVKQEIEPPPAFLSP